IDSKALGSFDRSTMHQVGGFAHHELECEYCGGCIQICPVGALTTRLAMYDYRPWQLKKTESICTYCGDGCLLTVEAVKENVVRVSSELGTGRNEGDLCARGFFGYGFINSKERLDRPALSVKGRMLQVTWEAALDKMAAGLKAIKAQHGAEAIGGIISTRCTNEEIFLFQKLMREVIGTPHVDSAVRYGYINAVRGLTEVFGTTRLARYEDIVHADVLLVFAGDMTETNPITGLKVKEAVKKKKAKLITVDSYGRQRDAYISHLPNLANQHLQIAFGTEGTAILGLMKAVAEGPMPAAAAPGSVDKIKQAVGSLSFEQIEAATGVPEAAYREAAALYAGAKRGVMIFGRAILRSDEGYQNVLHLAELAMAAGQVGREGTGILALAEENNEAGAAEMGGASEYLPGLIPAVKKGHTLIEMIDAAARGEIKALYLVGENPLRSLPQKKVEEALRKLDLLICQDLFMSETAALAQVILPAASYAEKSGHFTNHEGEIQKVHKAVEPIGNAKPDAMIFSIVAKKLDLMSGSSTDAPHYKLFHYKTPDEIWREIMMSMPAKWPALSPQQIAEKMAAYSGKGSKGRAGAAPRPSESVSNGAFHLQIGQILFHSGKLSTYASGLTTLFPKEAVLIHPDDAERLGLEEGEVVSLSMEGAPSGVTVPVKLSKKLARGTLFFPEHFGLEVKKLLPLTVDPTTGVPYGDRGKVTLTKAAVPVR
ncbi:MAG TPA: molybdopterin-dependent oxidoreductase, partial [Candidatus Manganitrophaceae bacterium]|nr:molybdopterin-dependent oxidoreductase [Candidatus Manganitrophaceae bacterium]